MMARRIISTISLLLLLLIAVPVVAQTLTVSTDKSMYIPGDTVVVSGTAPANQYVSIDIVNPDGKIVDTKIVTSGSDGRYTASFKLPSTIPYGDWKAGKYTVRAYVGTLVATTQFDLIPGGVVKGRVVDEAGAPVADATVTAVETGVTITTGSDGRFSIVTGAGTFTIAVSKSGYVSTSIKVTVATGEIKDVGDIKIVSQFYLLNATLADLSKRVKALEDEIKSIKDSVDAMKNSVDTVNNNINVVSQRIASIENAINALNTALSDLKNAVDGVSKSVNTLTNNIAAITSNLNTVASKVDTISSKVDAVSGKVDSVLNAVSGVVSKIDALSSKLDAVSNSLGGKIDTVSDSIKSISAAVGDMANKVNDVSRKVDAMSSDVAGLSKKIDDAVTTVTSAINNVGNKVDNVGNKVDTATSTLGNKIDSATSTLQTYVIITLVFALIAAAASIYAVVQLGKKLAG
ncbi:hypothetical protein Igag_0042 [Ignisphaera aggregans DSM 17230]|uniref:Macroglobulin domain-containing protein n=1 Tax=Ignisphaera aggregans (strain DSM 17230 / JCM 13409 / AQ1.S1) TaxID=583356 RepID=E0SPF2_IGNAA|nr:hypothetical protein Igag_0042 [Ignisphaera aggregans DSM 17230]